MAANFWSSTHAKQLVSREQLFNGGKEDRSRGLAEQQLQKLKAFFISFISEICRGCRLRQRVTATSSVFFHRYLLRVPLSNCDPYVVAGGCVYVASKVEETGLQAKLVLHFMNKKCGQGRYHAKSLLEMEIELLEKLDFSLVVFSPYKPLTLYLEKLKETLEERPFRSLAERSWAILNDSYRTSLSLLYPPYLIALGCLSLAASISGIDLELLHENVEAEWGKVYGVAMELSTMYEGDHTVISSEETNRLLQVLKGEGDARPTQQAS